MPPKARICYICGRPTLLPGYPQHVIQCKALFEKREMAKPAKERRALPRDPMELMGGSTRGGKHDLDALNDVAMKSWEQTLLPCQNCGRTFLPEKLPIHQRSCTVSNPARRVGKPSGYADESSYDFQTTNSFGEKRSGGYDQSIARSQSGKFPPERDYRSSSGGSARGGLKFEDFPTYGHLIKCADCGRNFNEVSYPKHAKICRKVFQQKRKPYDSAKHRAEGTELAQYQNSRKRFGGSSATSNPRNSSSTYQSSTPRTLKKSGGGLPKWKEQSLAFRQAVRQARLVTKAEQKSKITGIPIHKLLPSTQSGYNDFGGPPSDYIQCPTCGRSFNQKAGERHIPQCKNIINKPKRLVRGTGHSAVSQAFSSPEIYAVRQHDHRSVSGRSTFDDDYRAFSNAPVSSRRTTGSSDYSNGPPTSSRRTGVNDPVRMNSSVFRR